MRKLYLLLAFLVVSIFSYGQDVLSVGSGKLESRENVKEILSGEQQLPRGVKFMEQYYVVLTFESIPNQEKKDALAKQGINLLSYIGNNTYYATIKSTDEVAIQKQLVSSSVVSVLPVDPMWKIAPQLLKDAIPEHAKVANDIVRVSVIVFDTADKSTIEREIKSKGFRINSMALEFNVVNIELPLVKLMEFAATPWVKWIEFVAPPMELDNNRGRSMTRSNILGSNLMGQRELSGKGVNVGIWDGSIEAHPDLGDRLVSKEFEYMSEHGQHVSGTLAGAGLIDPKGKGMAPGATVFAWNFNTQQNGLSVQQEMLMSARDNGVAITSNSYGVPMSEARCTSPVDYNATDLQLDQLVGFYPALAHVFSVGNDQQACMTSTGSLFGTSTKRAKNAIFVGALDHLTGMTNFSSWGPTNDGRIIPHIATFGDWVYSTVYGNTYDGEYWSGTSMACPATSGTLALLYERYKQIYGDFPIASLAKAAILNTAEDKGNPGPDYAFGYGSLDGQRAVELIEKNRFFVGSVDNGEQNTHTINVPAGAKELRVMLVWSDYHGVSASKALINDLDLTVTSGSNTFLPWVLNPANPSANATPGVDRLNNQEQVTLANPNPGSYTITVNGFHIPQGPQEYALVYEYYMPTLTVTHPNGSEKFSPGEMPVVRWSSIGYEGDCTLQLSTDNGQTFQTIASNIPNSQKDYIITIPNTITDKALVRVIQNGTMDVSDAPFSIMPATSNLNLTPADCGGANWQLNWEAVDGASKYIVLKANVGEGYYYEIGETASTSFNLPELTADRNIYSVAAVSASNVVSERAYAVIANPSLPLDLQEVGFPFEEDFTKYPSDYVKVTAGSALVHTYEATLFAYSAAQNINLQGKADNPWNSTGDLFESNPNNVGKATICEIDATNISGNLFFRFAALLQNTGENNARMRVRVNGENLTNTYGQTELAATGTGQNIMYYNLADYVGTKFTLEIEAVLRNEGDMLRAGHFLLWQPEFDAGITSLTVPNPSNNLTSSETISIRVRNYSGEEIANVPVSYTVNGGSIVNEVIEGPIAPFSNFDYNFVNKANLSQEDVLITIEATVSVEGDETPSNNSRSAQTTRFGNYYVMPKTNTGNTLVATAEPAIFTDDGGKVMNYSNAVNGAVVINPTTTGKKVKIKFTEFNVEDNYDILRIRSGNLSTSPIIATLTGSELPEDIYSLASDGSLRVEFISDAEGTRSGWVAEVSEVDASEVATDNTYTLSMLSNYNGNYSAPTNIRITVKNNTTETVTNVPVRYRVDDGEWVNGVIPTIAGGASQAYTFAQQLTIPELGTAFTLTAEVTGEDGLMTDNVISRALLSDKYCFSYSSGSSWSGGGLFLITNVAKSEESNPTSATTQGGTAPQYFRSTVFPLYKDLDNEEITVNINAHRTGGKIGIWVDWNNDGDYTNDGGPYSVNTTEGVTSYSIAIPVPSGTEPGMYFVRVRATTHSTLDPCASEYSNNGEVEDYMVRVFNSYPTTLDVAPIATNLANGSNLSANETVTVTIQNNASVPVSNFNVAMSVNEAPEVVETVTDEIHAFGTYEYTFTATADLSEAGPHTVEIYTQLTDDQDTDNDLLVVNIFNEKPAVDGFFALNFDGVNDVVNAGTLGGTNLQSYTYEAWINPASYGGHGGPIGFGRLFEGKAATIFLHGSTNTNYPDQCLVISTGGGSYHTNANSISLNEWQHVAVSFDNASKALKVYLNGVEIPVVVKTAATTIDNNAASSLYIGNNSGLARPFEGIIDIARVWSIAKSQADVAANMHTSVAGSANLIAEFLFNEGYFNSKTYSGSIEASILNADISISESSIWVEPSVELLSFAHATQVVDWYQVNGNHYRLEVENETDLSSLAPTFKASMPGAVVTVSGVTQTSGVSTVDFSNSLVTPIEYVVTATYQGKTLTNTYTIDVIKEPSMACELLTFSIPSLGIEPSTVAMNMEFDVDASTDISSLVTNFTISDEARAYVNNVEIFTGSSIDYTNPVVIEVVAANNRTIGYYNISLRKQQTITWEPATLAKTYGDPEFTLEATSNTPQDIYYTSNNPEVISVVLNRATVVGVGSATITAHQLASNSFAEATPVAKEFSVAKAPLTIIADDHTIEFSDAIPELTMSFSGFVNGENESVIAELPSISTTAVQNSPAGDYPITLTGGNDNNYSITLNNGTLRIIDVDAFDVNFSVTYNGNPDQGVNININGIDLTTDENGEATIKLKAGTYVYIATKTGREDYSGTVTVVDAAQAVDIVLLAPLPIFTITYTTDGNGSITGNTTQSVKQGFDGTEVTASPKLGYEFDKWSDDVTTATRKEEDVQGDISVTALFKLKVYTLTYITGTNGTIIGDDVQYVEHGASGAEVEVIPADGYSFVQWSDDVTDNPRTDVNVMMDKTVTAEYTKIYSLPYTQTFDGTTLPEDWENVDNNASGGVWQFKAATKDGRTLAGSSANYATLDSDFYGSGKSQNADLISPTFDLTSYSAVNLKFNHYYRHYSSSATVSYSINGGAWVEIQKWTTTTANSVEFDQAIDAVAGQNNVRFKWNYQGSWGYYWLVDDIEITGTSAAGDYTVTYRAGDNGALQGATDGIITQVVTAGENGPTVTAVPDPGFAFYQWSDGVTDNPRTDVVIRDIDVTAIFGSDCSPITSLPYFEDFNASTSAPDCWNAPANANGKTWTFGPGSYTVSSGNSAYFDGMSVGYGVIETAELVSPTFDLSGQSQAYLSFRHLHYPILGSTAKVMYSDDNGATWSELSVWTGDVWMQHVCIEIPTLSSTVKFKWEITCNSLNLGWYIDDVEVRTEPTVMLTYNAQEAQDENDDWYYMGYIDGNRTQVLVVGEDATSVTAVPYEGFRFTQWSDGVTNNPRTDLNVTETKTITAGFEAIPMYAVSYSIIGSNGTLNAAAGGTEIITGSTIAEGTEVVFTATPEVGYRVKEWTNNGVPVAENVTNTYIISSIMLDIDVTVEFESIPTYTLTYTAGANGTITGEATQTVEAGANGTAVTAVADAGYHFVKWSDGLTENPRTDENITANISVEAEFTEDVATTYTLTYTAGANGSITGEATQTVEAGANGTAVTAVANNGYHFVKWNDGVTANPRTDKNVTADITVEAEFAINTYTLTYTAGDNGSLTGETAQTVNHGANGTAVEAVAATGYHFVKWNDGVTANPRTDKNVTADITVEAEFAVTTYTLTFVVLDKDQQAIANARISINGADLTTDSEGKAEVDLANGTYDYAVELEGYETVSDEVTIYNANKEVTINMVNVGAAINSLADVRVYPNPFSSRLVIGNAESVTRVEITNMIGQNLYRHTLVLGEHELIVPTSSLKAGVYLVSIYTNDGKRTVRKVIKE